MRLRLLGALDLRDSSETALTAALAQPKRTALLAYLVAAEPRDLHRRDSLLACFWPESDAERARQALNQSLHFLRRVVGPGVIVTREGGAVSVDPERLSCDVIAFEEAVARDAHEEALEWYRGPLLAGFFLKDAPAFEEWLGNERTRLARRAASSAWTLAERAAGAGDATTALAWGQRAANIHPDEQSVRRLMALHDRTGDRAGALREYAQFARQLQEEYGADPSPETQSLLASVRTRVDVNMYHPATSATPVAVEQPLALVAAVSSATGRRWRRRKGVAALVAAALFAAGAGTLALRNRSAAVSSNAARTVLVLPFTYNGGPDLSYLGAGIAHLLDSDLDGAGDLKTVGARAVASERGTAAGPATMEEGAKLAQRFGAERFIVGEVTEAGGRLRISASIGAPNAVGTVVNAKVDGKPGDLFELVDALAAQLMTQLDASAPARRYRSAALTTHSIEALRAYLRGEAEYTSGRYPAAVSAFQRAIDGDSTFALAYRGLSGAASWTAQSAIADWAAERALAYSGRLATRQRAGVEAWSLYLRGVADSAEFLYRRLAADDEYDLEARTQLAEIAFHWGPSLGRPSVDSRPDWRRALELEPRNASALLHAARLAARAGDSVEFNRLASQLERSDPDENRVIELRLLRAFAFGDHPGRVVAAERFALIPVSVARGILESVAVASPDQADVAELLVPPFFARQTFESRDAGMMFLRAQFQLARGHARAASATVDSAMSLHEGHAVEYRAVLAMLPLPQAAPAERLRAARALSLPLPRTAVHPMTVPLRHYLLGMLAVRAGDTATAERSARTLDAFRSVRSADTAYSHRFARVVRAEAMRSAGNSARALALLGEPHLAPDHRLPHVYSFPLAHERFLRAELLSDVHRPQDALAWLSTFPDPAGYDFMYAPAARLREAQFHEALGERAAAAVSYRRFLALWADADPELAPVVTAAKARLATLSR
ncbi:MAG: transcriptional activator protein [Gemmatimonadetes bacterium]|nr:transcriptional activator protein [Gemmatimonadota bacterium]